MYLKHKFWENHWIGIKHSSDWDIALKILYKTDFKTQCTPPEVLWKYAAKLQANTHAEVWFQ